MKTPKPVTLALDFSPEQIYTSSHQQDIATWLAHKYLKLNMSQTELIMLLLCLCAW